MLGAGNEDTYHLSIFSRTKAKFPCCGLGMNIDIKYLNHELMQYVNVFSK